MCKFGNKNVFLTLWHFWWNFFDFPNFSIYRKWDFSIFLKSFPQRFFGLITCIIKLFQTVQIQKCRFKICKSKCHLKYEKTLGAKLLLRSIYTYLIVPPMIPVFVMMLMQLDRYLSAPDSTVRKSAFAVQQRRTLICMYTFSIPSFSW